MFLLSSCYSLLLSNQNHCLFIYKYLSYPSQVYDKEKTFPSGVCVYCIMSCSEIFLSQDGVSLYSTGCTKKNCSFRYPCFSNFEKTAAVLIFWLTPRIFSNIFFLLLVVVFGWTDKTYVFFFYFCVTRVGDDNL